MNFHQGKLTVTDLNGRVGADFARFGMGAEIDPYRDLYSPGPDTTGIDRASAVFENSQRRDIRSAGKYALIDRSQCDTAFGFSIGARFGGGPLIVGVGENQQYLASDIPALLKHTRRVLILDEGEIAVLRPTSARLTHLDGSLIEREPLTIEWDAEAAEKGGYPHFALKEIHEQPEALRRALTGRVRQGQLHLTELEKMRAAGQFEAIQRVVVVACGTSFHAGLVAKYAIEQWARIPVEVVTAAEFRYSDPIVGPETLCIAVTQSG